MGRRTNGAQPSRAVGWPRLSGRAGRGSDPASSPHPLHRGRLRRPDDRAQLQACLLAARGRRDHAPGGGKAIRPVPVRAVRGIDSSRDGECACRRAARATDAPLGITGGRHGERGRRPHRRARPARIRQRHRRGPRRAASHGRTGLAARDRRGPVQERERHLRPPGRRRRASTGGRRGSRAASCRSVRGPLRRRRVRGAATRTGRGWRTHGGRGHSTHHGVAGDSVARGAGADDGSDTLHRRRNVAAAWRVIRNDVHRRGPCAVRGEARGARQGCGGGNHLGCNAAPCPQSVRGPLGRAPLAGHGAGPERARHPASSPRDRGSRRREVHARAAAPARGATARRGDGDGTRDGEREPAALRGLGRGAGRRARTRPRARAPVAASRANGADASRRPRACQHAHARTADGTSRA